MPRRACARRAALGGLAAAAGLLASRKAAAASCEIAEWYAFRQRFVQADGRVRDTGNGGQSHTEGQGWTMLFAARFDDRDTFCRVFTWTERVLRRSTDALHAWRCRPGNELVVDDPNNATDGDLFIAWALLEAGYRWGDSGLTQAGLAITADILRLLVRDCGGRRVLLPGAHGFDQAGYLVVNPSYYVFPAFAAIAAVHPHPAWAQIYNDGLNMLRAARFGRWGLMPDWLAVPNDGSQPEPAPGWPMRFSYDAVRVPLYMSWAGLAREPGVADPAHMWADPRHNPIPAWCDLVTGSTSDYQAPSGIVAVARLAMASSIGQPHLAPLPSVCHAQDYYSAALTLLSRLAWRDTGLPMA